MAVKILADALAAAGVPVSLQWTDDERSMADGLAQGRSANAGVFWHGANCEAPHRQSATEAGLCDRAVLTEPLMQAVVAVFIRRRAAGVRQPGRRAKPHRVRSRKPAAAG